MSIRAKLLVAFGVVLTLLGGVGLAGWRATRCLPRSMSR